MKAILKFELPEEQEDFDNVLKAPQMQDALRSITGVWAVDYEYKFAFKSMLKYSGLDRHVDKYAAEHNLTEEQKDIVRESWYSLMYDQQDAYYELLSQYEVDV